MMLKVDEEEEAAWERGNPGIRNCGELADFRDSSVTRSVPARLCHARRSGENRGRRSGR